MPPTIHINADDETQASVLVQTCRLICRYQRRYRRPLDQARINALALQVQRSRGDHIATLERRADQREISRLGWDGWNE
jgi:hypothetical protein